MEESTNVLNTLSIFAPGTPKTYFVPRASSIRTTTSAPVIVCFAVFAFIDFPFELTTRLFGDPLSYPLPGSLLKTIRLLGGARRIRKASGFRRAIPLHCNRAHGQPSCGPWR